VIPGFKLALTALSTLTLGAVVFASARGGVAASAAPPPGAGDGSIAIVELFTSQGCSSCPPADRLLSKLAESGPYKGRVLPLSFHVDYWNYIGWQDPFSSAQWTARQKQYAQRAFHTGRIYTPQVVVDGRAECIGSNEAEVLEKLRSALAEGSAARVTLRLDPLTPEGQLHLHASANLLRDAGKGAAGARPDLDLWVAIYESGLSTEVKAGENTAKLLRNDRVVRRLEKVLSLPGKAGAKEEGEIRLGIDKRWKASELGVAAFLQDPSTLAIYGAAGAEVTTKAP
jgi:hypothetical protein